MCIGIGTHTCMHTHIHDTHARTHHTHAHTHTHHTHAHTPHTHHVEVLVFKWADGKIPLEQLQFGHESFRADELSLGQPVPHCWPV